MHFVQYLLICCLAIWGQAAAEKPVLLLNGTAHLGNGKVISNAAIVVEDQQVTMVADATRIRINPTGFRITKIPGKHVYAAILAGKESPATSQRTVKAGDQTLVANLEAKALEQGCPATLIVTEQPLETHPQATVSMAFVAGKEIDLANKPNDP